MDGANDASLPFSRMRPHVTAPAHRDELAHVVAIREIADGLGQPYEEVDALYRHLFHVLAAQANVTQFLQVLVARKVREHYSAATR